MALPSVYPVAPGSFMAWNAEYATINSLQHTAVQVLVVALDIREDCEPWVLYIVNGPTPVMTACRLEHFRASCSPYAGQPWADGSEVEAAMLAAVDIVRLAPAPGLYNFSAVV